MSLPLERRLAARLWPTDAGSTAGVPVDRTTPKVSVHVRSHAKSRDLDPFASRRFDRNQRLQCVRGYLLVLLNGYPATLIGNRFKQARWDFSTLHPIECSFKDRLEFSARRFWNSGDLSNGKLT